MKQKTKITCTLCNSSDVILFEKDKIRDYYLCNKCKLIFVPHVFYISNEKEKARYDTHQNNIESKGYVDFLKKVFIPVNNIISKNSKGLDYGSGPNPVLSVLFINAGHSMTNYDPFYTSQLDETQKYDFITATEVAEHFHNPMKEFRRMQKRLRPSGILGIMTSLTDNIDNFPNWYYKNDETHVCFFSKDTFNYLAKKLKMSVSFIEKKNVIILKQNKLQQQGRS